MALVDLFLQNVPAEAPHVLAVKTGSGGFRPQVWHIIKISPIN